MGSENAILGPTPKSADTEDEPSGQWLPIESAPMDGTKFLAWCVETGRQGPDIAWWQPNTFATKVGGYFKTRYGWIPTHWMPLPEPPQ